MEFEDAGGVYGCQCKLIGEQKQCPKAVKLHCLSPNVKKRLEK